MNDRLTISRLVWLITGCTLLSACHESGTWQDDARNWKRIFREDKPADIQVVHSWFWRSPHFTYEYEYFIQVRKNEDFKKRLFGHNNLRQLTEPEALADAFSFSQHRPDWFVPKPKTSYDTWVYAEEPRGEFRTFLDLETGDIYLTDSQL